MQSLPLSATSAIGGLDHIPVVGLGTWKSSDVAVSAAVEHALKSGYRHIDCASIYGNEDSVGKAFGQFFANDSPVKREDVFVTTKIFNHLHSQAGVRASLERSLSDLQLSHVDLALMHWPAKFLNEEFFEPLIHPSDFPSKFSPMRLPSGLPNENLEIGVEFKETWRAMVSELGKTTRFAGVSNFGVDHLRELLAFCDENSLPKPVVNQVEFHPLVFPDQKDLIEFCSINKIVLTAYSPLGSGDSYSGFQKDSMAPCLLTDPSVIEIAQKLGRTAGQVLIRWCIQRGVSVIPKSEKPARIEENFDVFSFSIPEEDMIRLDSVGGGKVHRFGLGWLPGHFLTP